MCALFLRSFNKGVWALKFTLMLHFEFVAQRRRQYEKYEGNEAEGAAGWARDGWRASAGTGDRAGGRGGDTGAGAAGVGGVRAPPAARAARREAQRLLVPRKAAHRASRPRRRCSWPARRA